MNGTVLRLLDANANRAREALRVLEDYARFVLNDRQLSADLKSLRHTFAEITAPYLMEAIAFRDTPGDVGTANKTAAEQTREDLAHIITAAGKRLGEALRSIEEFLKVESGADAREIELLRYAFYDLEQRIARTLNRGQRFADIRLYVLITEKLCSRLWLETARHAILGGADCLQLREKEMEGGELLSRARQLVALCREHQVLCIINDRADIALLSDADGVHVGQGDLPATEARKIVGREKIVGVSTHNIEQARKAVADGADYIGVGPFFPSNTKPREILPGPTYAREVATEISLPAVAIAGITIDNVDEVLTTGLRAIAVSSAVIAADDVKSAATSFAQKLRFLPKGGQTFLSVSPRSPVSSASPRAIVSPRSPVSPVSPRSIVSPVSPVSRAPKTPKNNPFTPTDKNLKITRRHLPHWELPGSVYFITFRVMAQELTPADRAIVMDHLKSGHGQFYELFAAVIMPDHSHLLLKPNEGVSLVRITKGIKGVCARLLNAAWNTNGHVWQDESWDRIVRDQADFDEKLEYMLNNPVRKGLVEDPWKYDGWYYGGG